MANNLFGGMAARFRKPVAPTITAGASGTVILAGYIQQKEENPLLKDGTRYETFANMLANVSIIGASVRYFLNLAGKASWSVEPADDSPAAQEIADFVLEAMHDMRTPWHRVIRRALGFRYWGFSIQEWTAKKREDGKVGMLDVAPRPQHTIELWDADDDDYILGVGQRDPKNSQIRYLPRTKIVYVVDDSLSDSPEGLGLFRHMTDTAYRLQRYQDLEGVGFETDLRGIPKGRAPYSVLNALEAAKTISKAEKDTLLKPMDDFIANHVKSVATGYTMDSSTYRDTGENGTPSATPLWDMELMTGGNTSAEAIDKAIIRLQTELARLSATEGLMLGGGATGSLALSRDKSHQLAVVVDSALAEVKEAFQSDFVRTLMLLNGIAEDLWPTLKPEAIQFRDLEQLSQLLVDIAAAGGVLAPDDPVINALRSLAGLPDAPEVDLTTLGLGGADDDPDDELDLEDKDPEPGPAPDVPDPADED